MRWLWTKSRSAPISSVKLPAFDANGFKGANVDFADVSLVPHFRAPDFVRGRAGYGARFLWRGSGRCGRLGFAEMLGCGVVSSSAEVNPIPNVFQRAGAYWRYRADNFGLDGFPPECLTTGGLICGGIDRLYGLPRPAGTVSARWSRITLVRPVRTSGTRGSAFSSSAGAIQHTGADSPLRLVQSPYIGVSNIEFATRQNFFASFPIGPCR